MASGSSDGSVTFWDLETFESISEAPHAPGVSGGVGSIAFAPNGLSLLASYPSSLCVWGWEPPTCLDTVGADWDHVMDMTIVNDQLIACTVRDDQVATWMVSMQKLTLSAPSGQAAPHKTHKPLDTSYHDYKVNSVRNAIKASDSGQAAQLRAFELPTTQEDDDTPDSPDTYKPVTVSSPTIQSPAPVSTPSPAAPPSTASAQSRQKPTKKSTPHPTPSKGLGIDITPFTQKSSNPYDDLNSESNFMSHVAEYSNNVAAVLNKRLSHFKKAKASWTENGSGTDSKGILAVVGTISKMEDAAVTVEVLRMLPHREDYLTLDLCTALLPLMINLFHFTYEDYLLQALAWTSRLVKAFGHVIKTTREAPQIKGVDISKEERLEKCQTCHGHLVTIQQLVGPLSRRAGSVGGNAKDLAALLKIYVPEA